MPLHRCERPVGPGATCGRPGETPPRSTPRHRRSAELLCLPLDRPAEEHAVRLLVRRTVTTCLLEPLARQPGEPARRSADGDALGSQPGGDACHRHEVPACGRGHRDDSGHALDVVCCAAVVPDDLAAASTRDRSRRIAAVRAEDEPAAALLQQVVAQGDDRRTALVVLEQRAPSPGRAPRPRRPRASTRPAGVPAAEGDERPGCLRGPGGRRASARSRTRRAARLPCATGRATGPGTSARASRCRPPPRRRCSVSTTRPWIEAVWYPFSGSTHESATRGLVLEVARLLPAERGVDEDVAVLRLHPDGRHLRRAVRVGRREGPELRPLDCLADLVGQVDCHVRLLRVVDSTLHDAGLEVLPVAVEAVGVPCRRLRGLGLEPAHAPVGAVVERVHAADAGPEERRRPAACSCSPSACASTSPSRITYDSSSGWSCGCATPPGSYSTMNIVCSWASSRWSTSIFTAIPL